MDAPPLFASKRCPHCGQWSDHRQQPDDRCQYCHELLDPLGPQRAAELEKAWKWEMPPVMLVPVLPTDSGPVRLFKYLVRGGQLLFAATVSLYPVAYRGRGWLALAPLRQPLFVAAVVGYGGYQVLARALHWRLSGWATSWLADALCLPVVLTLALVVQRVVRGRPTFVLPSSWVVAAWLYLSLCFELLLPFIHPARYTADWLDVVAYAAGAWAFSRWLNRSGSPQAQPKP